MPISKTTMSKPAQAAPWARDLAAEVTREVTRPVFPRLPAGLRPYLLAGGLFAIASALMGVGNAALLRYGFSWALASLLVVVAAASLWGVRPGLLVLALSAVYGAAVVPHLQPPPRLLAAPAEHVLVMRTLLFVTCGAAGVWLTQRARQMQSQAETRRGVVTALRSSILPDTLAKAPGYDVGGVYRPFHQEEEVGGDFYDFYPVGGGRYGLLLGDVMGKGKEAAASIALLRYSVRAFSSTDIDPAQIMAQLDGLIARQQMRFETASLFLGILDTQAGRLRYASAGHEPPLLRRADGGEEALDSTGPILGIGLGAEYEEETVRLDVGDALLLMTDGVTEARDERGQFVDSAGAWRLLRAALAEADREGLSSQAAVAALDTALAAMLGPRQRDDIAMLLLRRVVEER